MNKATVTPAGDQSIHIERIFDATPDKIFKAMTTKELVEKWWVGPGYDIKVEHLDARDGGSWKYVQSKDGQSFSFFGSFHEVSPTRVVQTFEFSGLPERGHVAIEKMELTEIEGGKTKMTVNSTYMTPADRDGMIASGMEDGLQNTYRQLDKVLAEM